MNRSTCIFLVGLLSAIPPCMAAEPATPAPPFNNPFVAASPYPFVHANANLTSVAGPVVRSHRLRADEIDWKPAGPFNAFAPVYSGTYPNGKRVIWAGGYDRIAKLDADTLEVLATYAMDRGIFYSDDQVERHVTTVDSLQDSDYQKYLNYVLKFWEEPFFRSAESVYHMVSRDNEFYIGHRGLNGELSLQVYGETDASNPASPITLRREWKSPTDISKTKIMSMNMTSDGTVAIVTMDGVMVALPRDLSTYHVIRLPRKGEESGSRQDFFSAFVRNGMTTDDRNGIYVVTRDNMVRVQWTGKKLSLDEADGAWSVPYPNSNGLGSGSTPQLLGWGPHEDHLAMVTDGTQDHNNVLVFWRDAIPSDWKGIPGYDRRVAGILPLRFGVSPDEKIQVENTPLIWGYDAFIDNAHPEQSLPDQGSPTKQWLAESYSFRLPGHEARGGQLVRWDPAARKLKSVWQSPMNFACTVGVVSSATGILYTWGARNGEWTVEGVDWKTGKSVFHYTLGKSNRFNPIGAPVYLDPKGNIISGTGASWVCCASGQAKNIEPCLVSQGFMMKLRLRHLSIALQALIRRRSERCCSINLTN